MKTLSKKITFSVLGFAVALTGIVLYSKRDRIVEAYYIYQLEDETKRIEAARYLAEVKCLRAIPSIVETFGQMVEEDQQETLFIESFSIMTICYFGGPPKEVPPSNYVNLHPLLFALHSMGTEGTEILKQAQSDYFKAPPKKTGNARLDSELVIRMNTLKEAYGRIIMAWESPKKFQIKEGTEERPAQQMITF